LWFLVGLAAFGVFVAYADAPDSHLLAHAAQRTVRHHEDVRVGRAEMTPLVVPRNPSAPAFTVRAAPPATVPSANAVANLDPLATRH
jgi:hypothetical protein